MTRTSRFDFALRKDPDPAYQWDTKHKLFSLAEVCALPSGVLVYFVMALMFLVIIMSNPLVFTFV